MQLKSIQKIKQRKKTIPVRVTEEESFRIKRNADLYAGGSVSGWIRYTSLNYRPDDDELAMTSDNPCLDEEDK